MKHWQWTAEDWKKVFGSSRRIVVQRQVGERMVPQCVTPTVIEEEA